MPRNCKPKLTVLVHKKAEIQSADDRWTIRHLSADDRPLVCRPSATHPQRVCSSGANGRDLPDSAGHPQIPFMDTKITRGNLAKFEVGTLGVTRRSPAVKVMKEVTRANHLHLSCRPSADEWQIICR
ncbi:hypothetical protein B0H13DRAFT_1858746 [Mycena leptocephala]|nr:hypothetical protein B0H13DRAFT_1858746 [Mycena leptocephala]